MNKPKVGLLPLYVKLYDDYFQWMRFTGKSCGHPLPLKTESKRKALVPLR